MDIGITSKFALMGVSGQGLRLTTAEQAAVAVFLTSYPARYLTNASFIVDGEQSRSL